MIDSQYQRAQAYYAQLRRRFIDELSIDMEKYATKNIEDNYKKLIKQINENYESTKIDDATFQKHFNEAIQVICDAYINSPETNNSILQHKTAMYLQKKSQEYQTVNEKMKKNVRASTKAWISKTYKNDFNKIFNDTLFQSALSKLQMSQSINADYGVLKNLLIAQARLRMVQNQQKDSVMLLNDLTSKSAQKGISTSFKGMTQEHDVLQAILKFFGSDKVIHSGEVKRATSKGGSVDIGSDILIFAQQYMDEESNKLKNALSSGSKTLPIDWESPLDNASWKQDAHLAKLYGVNIKKWSTTIFQDRKYVSYGLSLGYHDVGLKDINTLEKPYYTNLLLSASNIISILGVRNVIFANADEIQWMDGFIESFRKQGLYAQVATRNDSPQYYVPRGSYSAIELNINKWQFYNSIT